MADRSSDNSPSTPSSSTTPEEKSSNNWWDSWISSAKTKSAEVYSMVKKDLDEIGTAVKSEASHVFSTTSTVIGKTLKLDDEESTANVMKKSLSTFIGQVSTVLNPEPDDEDDTEVILSSGDTTMLSTYKKELEALQRVDATFIVPAYSGEFEAWKATIEGSDVLTPSACQKRLNGSTTLREQYQKLVPDAVSHEEFWERYMFRQALLQDRLAAVSRQLPPSSTAADPVMEHLPLTTVPQPIQQSPKRILSPDDIEPTEESPADTTVAWDHEDLANDIELTEEQQILLLEEYEKEIANKKQTKQTSTRDITKSKTTGTNTKAANAKKTTTQTRDKMNNKQTTDKKTKQTIDKKIKNVRPAQKKAGKADVCGNNMVEDYFGDKDAQKDDASANSDESWEKEFEIEADAKV